MRYFTLTKLLRHCRNYRSLVKMRVGFAISVERDSGALFWTRVMWRTPSLSRNLFASRNSCLSLLCLDLFGVDWRSCLAWRLSILLKGILQIYGYKTAPHRRLLSIVDKMPQMLPQTCPR